MPVSGAVAAARCGEVDEIIAWADAACYAAKAVGRGCVSAAPDEASPDDHVSKEGVTPLPLAAAS
ncbi:hypothetical protein MPLSOD_20064 [Mesorhizobium sp. SOD10]|nr:hypothetical protein MPLSOD_20064 [Mesorhizobium sp. SOD10]